MFEPKHIAGGSLDQIFTFSMNNQLQSSINVDSSRSLSSDHLPVYCNLDLDFENKYYKEITYRKIGNIDVDEFSDCICEVITGINDNSSSFPTIISRLSFGFTGMYT